MKNKIYYAVGILFLIIGFYQLYLLEYLESTMYFTLGIGFIITGLITNKLFLNHHKFLGAVSWIMIFIALFIFLFLLRTDMR